MLPSPNIHKLTSSPQLFASQYSLILPSEEDLRAELERDRAILEAAREDSNTAAGETG